MASETKEGEVAMAAAGAGAAAAAPGGAAGKRFEVKKWNAVALWSWDIVVDNCAICRNHIMDLCALE
jgi:RING-box protein 1